MVADPTLTPVTCGCVAGRVAPEAMVTVLGDTVTLVESLLERVTVTPPFGAGVDNWIASVADCPSVRLVFCGTVTEPGWATDTLVVVLTIFGVAVLAVMMADPGATPVIGTVALVALAANVTVAGTVAAAVLFDDRLNVKPEAGAATDNTSVTFWVAVP